MYDSFGNLTSETFPAINLDFGFTGRWTDEATGMTNHLNRWFDPAIGKWLSNDPIGFGGGDANTQRYVANNPLSFTDNNGLKAQDPGGGGDDGGVMGVIGINQGADQGGGGQEPPKVSDFDSGTLLIGKNKIVRSCIVCHNPIIANGGSVMDLPENFRLGASEFLGTTDPGKMDDLMEVMRESEDKGIDLVTYNTPFIGQTRVAIELGLGKNIRNGQPLTNIEKFASGVVIIAPIVFAGVKQIKVIRGSLPDDAFVVRGGQNTPSAIVSGTGTHPSGIIGVSVESAPGKTIKELASSPTVPHGQIGVTTVGKVRNAGGNVIPTSGHSPNHATLTGLTAEQASDLLRPTIPNPARKR